MSSAEAAARERRKKRLARAGNERISYICGERKQAEPTEEELKERERIAREALEKEAEKKRILEEKKKKESFWRTIGFGFRRILWLLLIVMLWKFMRRERNNLAFVYDENDGVLSNWNTVLANYDGFYSEGSKVLFNKDNKLTIGRVTKCVAGEKERCCDPLMDNLKNVLEEQSIKPRSACVFTVIDQNGHQMNVIRKNIIGKLIISLPFWGVIICIAAFIGLIVWSLRSHKSVKSLII